LTAKLALSFWLVANIAYADTYTLRVDGLACPFCSYGIEKQLRKLSGVKAVTTNIKTGTIRVRTETGKKLTKAELRAAVKRSGFTLRGLK
jgi:mercuric ion binding protein